MTLPALDTAALDTRALDAGAIAPVASVPDGRARIDDLDDRLMALLAQRRAVSIQIQRLRVEAGGSRVQHSRENEIIQRWSETLGDGGVDLALAVLGHCRGRH